MTVQPSPPQATAAENLSTEVVHTILRAARFGHQAYSGPIGELIDRELRAYIDTGRQLPPNSIPERLLKLLLALQGAVSSTAESTPSTAASPEQILPARYRKGTPLHWEFTPRTETPAPAATRSR